MRIAALAMMLGLVACGNSNKVEINFPEIVSGNLEVISLNDNHIMVTAGVSGTKTRFGAAELGLGVEPVEIRISSKDKGAFSALIETKDQVDFINVNPLTSLAACRYRFENDLEKQNVLIAKQFGVSNLQHIEPDMEFSKMDSFTDASAYGILIGAFDELAKNVEVSSSRLLELLCEDVSFDGHLDGTSGEGMIQSSHPLYDEQVLKAGYAKAIDDFALKNINSYAKLPIQAFANEISLSNATGLFSPTIQNYSFDQ